METTHSSPEHCVSCLSRIRAAVNWGASGDEWKATLAVFLPALQRRHPLDVRAACERWAEDEPRWPSLSQLLGKVAEAELRRHPPRLAHSVESGARPVATPTIRDPAAMRRLIEHIRRNPTQYVAAKDLIGIGEAMLERAGFDVLKGAS